MHATIASIYVGSGGKLKCLRGKYSTDRAALSPASFGTFSLYVLCLCVFATCMHVYRVCAVPVAISRWCQSFPLDLELEAVVSHLVGAGN